jgi:predicted N-formylglutamate amidohydrolase
MAQTDFTAYRIEGQARSGRYLICCDHACNAVPPWVSGGDLGLAAPDMTRHIAFDPGAAGVARALGRLLNSPVICAGFSRLVIDPNRGLNDPTLIMRLYDGTIIPANRHLTPQQVQMRLDRLYHPYHNALAALADRADCVIISIHSFTPCLMGRAPRPWHVGVLYNARDARLSQALLARLRGQPGLCVGENEPYGGHLPGDTLDRHALARGRHHSLIELRNDLIASPRAQIIWARQLAAHITAAAIDLAA